MIGALRGGNKGAAFQAKRTLHYKDEIVALEQRESFGDLGTGYPDIKLTGNRVVDPKDWTGWARYSSSQQRDMLRHLRRQTDKYLSNTDYSLRFEFRESIPEPVLTELVELQKIYGGRLSWEMIP